jgi:hypothetical protein
MGAFRWRVILSENHRPGLPIVSFLFPCVEGSPRAMRHYLFGALSQLVMRGVIVRGLYSDVETKT